MTKPPGHLTPAVRDHLLPLLRECDDPVLPHPWYPPYLGREVSRWFWII
ncbi:hypothetical protein ABZW30_35020 [Kitasatospora sp. NPDC004669]